MHLEELIYLETLPEKPALSDAGLVYEKCAEENMKRWHIMVVESRFLLHNVELENSPQRPDNASACMVTAWSCLEGKTFMVELGWAEQFTTLTTEKTQVHTAWHSQRISKRNERTPDNTQVHAFKTESTFVDLGQRLIHMYSKRERFRI